MPALHFFASSVPYQPQFLPHFPFRCLFYLHIFAMSGIGGGAMQEGAGSPCPPNSVLHHSRPRAESFAVPSPPAQLPLPPSPGPSHHCFLWSAPLSFDLGPSVWRCRTVTCLRAACNLPIKHQAVAARWTPTSVSMELVMCEIVLQSSNLQSFFFFFLMSWQLGQIY